ncbi:MAG: hypothetical protein NUV59_01070 [Patescibacteria group bacterium]|nr:hypothetical protein [Patescibacteria group bacterium]
MFLPGDTNQVNNVAGNKKYWLTAYKISLALTLVPWVMQMFSIFLHFALSEYTGIQGLAGIYNVSLFVAVLIYPVFVLIAFWSLRTKDLRTLPAIAKLGALSPILIIVYVYMLPSVIFPVLWRYDVREAVTPTSDDFICADGSFIRIETFQKNGPLNAVHHKSEDKIAYQRSALGTIDRNTLTVGDFSQNYVNQALTLLHACRNGEEKTVSDLYSVTTEPEN